MNNVIPSRMKRYIKGDWYSEKGGCDWHTSQVNTINNRFRIAREMFRKSDGSLSQQNMLRRYDWKEGGGGGEWNFKMFITPLVWNEDVLDTLVGIIISLR